MRIFIAIDLPKEIKDYLFGLEKEMSKFPVKCNFVSKKNLHLTLKFILDIKEKELDLIKERLNKIKFEKFKIFIKNLDFLPNKERPKVICLELNYEKKLFELQQEIESKLLGITPSDNQLFKSHITLGRIKLIKNKEKFIEEINKLKINKMEFEINSFSIYESNLTKNGPIYKKIEEYNSINNL